MAVTLTGEDMQICLERITNLAKDSKGSAKFSIGHSGTNGQSQRPKMLSVLWEGEAFPYPN
jgi:hypothetical protein